MIDVYKNVCRVMFEKGLKKNWVAEQAGFSKQALSAMKHHSPRVKTLERLAKVLNVDIAEFFKTPKY